MDDRLETGEPDQASAATRKEQVAAWLASHPEAMVGALDGSGQPVPVPDELVPAGIGLLGESLLDLVVAEDCRAVADLFAVSLQQGVCAGKVHLVADPGRLFSVHYLDLRPEAGVVLRVLLPTGEQAPLRNEAADRVTTTSVRLGTMTKDAMSRILSVDAAACAMLALKPEDMLGRRSIEFIHPEDQVRAIDNWMARHSSGHSSSSTVRLRWRRGDGDWLWTETSNDFTTAPDGSRVVSSQLIDISGEMAANDALRRNEAILRRITDTVPVGLFYVSAARSVMFVNPVIQELLGEKVVTSQWDLASRLLPERPSQLTAAIDRVMDQGEEVYLDLELQSAGGRQRSSCQVMLRPVTDDHRTVGALGCVVDVTDLRRVADTDPLTGLRNRRAITQVLEQELVTRGGRVAVVFVDLDRFKPVNDRHGHHFGDSVLAAVAHRLRESVRPADHIGRIGGDEFLVVCPGIRDDQEARAVAGRIQAAMGRPLQVSGRVVELSASVGAVSGRPGADALDLIASADSAMYDAKHRTGRGGVVTRLPLGPDNVTATG